LNYSVNSVINDWWCVCVGDTSSSTVRTSLPHHPPSSSKQHQHTAPAHAQVCSVLK